MPLSLVLISNKKILKRNCSVGEKYSKFRILKLFISFESKELKLNY